MCNEVRVASCHGLAALRRAGKHTGCSRVPGPKASVTLAEEGGQWSGVRNRARRWMSSLKALWVKRGAWIFFDYVFTAAAT